MSWKKMQLYGEICTFMRSATRKLGHHIRPPSLCLCHFEQNQKAAVYNPERTLSITFWHINLGPVASRMRDIFVLAMQYSILFQQQSILTNIFSCSFAVFCVTSLYLKCCGQLSVHQPCPSLSTNRASVPLLSRSVCMTRIPVCFVRLSCLVPQVLRSLHVYV